MQYPRKRGFYPRRKMTPWHERQIAKICHVRLAGWKGKGELEIFEIEQKRKRKAAKTLLDRTQVGATKDDRRGVEETDDERE